MREKDLDIGEFFVFITIKAFDFGKAAPPGIEFVIRHSNNAEVRWNKKKDLMLNASIIIMKLDAISTEFVSLGRGI